MGALASAVAQDKALYVGVSSYSMLNRWIEWALLDALGEEGMDTMREAFNLRRCTLVPRLSRSLIRRDFRRCSRASLRSSRP
jgi:hypothetical protein